MYLMNVPPVAAIHTEWRSCGPSRGFSQPLCFNDSERALPPTGTPIHRALPTTGTPIPDKVQMIIESLRSAQSSLQMGDETEGNVLSGQEEARPQSCAARGVGAGFTQGDPAAAGPKSKCRSPADTCLPEMASPAGSESLDSDSDGSVDRGIEEAIQEYLKEKDGHNKRKAEPATPDVAQPSKIQRKDHIFLPEIPKQHSESNMVLTTCIQAAPKSLRLECHAAPPVHAMKKVAKSKTPSKENPFKRVDTCKSFSFEQRRGPSNPNPVSDKLSHPATVKLEEDSPDSSSDDGIEEAIQLYQMEKKEEKKEERHGADREACRPLVLKDDSDSSSDDGIEEAIRSYQLEKQKEEKKSLPKPSLPKQKLLIKVPAAHSLASSSTQDIKKHKFSRKKKKKSERDVKSIPQTSSPSAVVKPSKPKGQGNGLFGPNMEPSREQCTAAILKVNTTTTTAELLCAEAILDISKAVMPEVFNPNVSLANSTSPESSSLAISHPDNRCDDSSVDSEDGIEQEIRKFLEQKAQLHKRAPGDSTPGMICSDIAVCSPSGADSATRPDVETVKQNPAQKKVMRLTLTRKRTLKGGSKQFFKAERVTDTIPKPLTECDRDSSALLSCQRDGELNRPVAQSKRREQSGGEKSSSLDSDEDLDTAIKDLLKTKKKLKKKTRDMKLKLRKGLKDVDAGKTVQSKKHATEPSRNKPAVLKRIAIATKTDNIKRIQVSKQQHKQHGNKRRDSLEQVNETDPSKGNGVAKNQSKQSCDDDDNRAIVQIKEDSSSVDSDDSIEQEIRRFLAEKAKVSTSTSGAGDGDETGSGNVKADLPPAPEKSITLENQLAEISSVEYNRFPDSLPPLCTSEQIPPNTSPTVLAAYPGSVTNLPRELCLSSAPPDHSSPLEPADGAGAAGRAERRRSTSSDNCDSQKTTPELAMCGSSSMPVPDLCTLPHSSDQRHERQVPPHTAKTRDMIQSPFHTSTTPFPNMGETATTTPPAYLCGVGISHRRRSTDSALDIPVVGACLTARSDRSIVPFYWSPETPAVATSSLFPLPTRTPTPKLVRRPPASFFMRGIATGGHWGQHPTMPELSRRVVCMAKDQTTFVELSTSKTSHVQVRSREGSEGKDRGSREGSEGKDRGSREGKDRGSSEGSEGKDRGSREGSEGKDRGSREGKDRGSREGSEGKDRGSREGKDRGSREGSEGKDRGSREGSEGKDRITLPPRQRESARESRMMEEKEQTVRREGSVVDETESDERRSPEKKQGCPTL